MSTIFGPPLVISDEQVGAATLVRCVGEIDLGTVPYLREHLNRVQVDGPAHLILDLDGVTFIDSLGLGALIGVYKRARVRRGSLALVCTSAPVLRVLAATALDRVFTVVGSIDEVPEPQS